MYYQLVDIETGKAVDQSLVRNKWFKKTLSRLNRQALEVEGRLKYAIACYIPSRIYVWCRWDSNDGQQGDIHWSKWLNVSDLSKEQQQRFWAWYGDDFAANSEAVPASKLLITDIPN